MEYRFVLLDKIDNYLWFPPFYHFLIIFQLCFLSWGKKSIHTYINQPHTHSLRHSSPVSSHLCLLSPFNFLHFILPPLWVFTLRQHRILIDLRLVLLGGPGSGKALQCERMEERFGLRRITLGDLLCSELQCHSERGHHLRDILERGEKVPEVSVVPSL